MSLPVIAFALAVLACAIAHVAIVVSVVRRASAPVEGGLPRPRRLVEIVWALVPILALAFVLTATWDRVRVNARPKPDLILKVAR